MLVFLSFKSRALPSQSAQLDGPRTCPVCRWLRNLPDLSLHALGGSGGGGDELPEQFSNVALRGIDRCSDAPAVQTCWTILRMLACHRRPRFAKFGPMMTELCNVLTDMWKIMARIEPPICL